MTSNQISAAVAREQERHDKEQELLAKRAQEEVERNNRINRILGAASVINNAASTLNASIKGSYGNEIAATGTTIEAQKAVQSKRYQEESLGLTRRQLAETERHQKEQDMIALRNVQHYEYADWLTAKQNEFMRNQKLFENNQQITENTFRQVQQQMDRYKAELERAHINNETLNAYMNQLNTMYEIKLKEAQTKAARAKVVADYMNASAQLIKAITGTLSIPMSGGL